MGREFFPLRIDLYRMEAKNILMEFLPVKVHSFTLNMVETGFIEQFLSRDYKFEYQLGHITFMKIDHEIISTIILPLPQIQEGQSKVIGESMCTSIG